MNDCFCEGPAGSRETDENCGVDLPDNVPKSNLAIEHSRPRGHAISWLDIDELLGCKTFSRRMQKSVFVNHPKATACVLVGKSVFAHSSSQQVCDSNASR